MFRIAFDYFNKHGEPIGSGVYFKVYNSEREAAQDAQRIYGNSKRFDWYIIDAE